MRLRGFEQKWAREVSRAFVGEGVLGGATSGKDGGALIAADCAAVPWVSALPVRLALWLVWWTPVLLYARSFGRLPAERREAVLERMLHSRLAAVRTLVAYLKLVCVSLLLGDARVLHRLGAYGLRDPRAAA